MTTISLVQENLAAYLFLFLSRWSLVTAFVILASVAVCIRGIGFTATDNALGPEIANAKDMDGCAMNMRQRS